jgi:hypothetical protein
MSPTVSEAQALKIIRRWIAQQGGVVASAKLLGVSAGYVSRVQAGKQPLSKALLRRLGITRTRAVVFTILPRAQK